MPLGLCLSCSLGLKCPSLLCSLGRQLMVFNHELNLLQPSWPFLGHTLSLWVRRSLLHTGSLLSMPPG